MTYGIECPANQVSMVPLNALRHFNSSRSTCRGIHLISAFGYSPFYFEWPHLLPYKSIILSVSNLVWLSDRILLSGI